MLYDATETPYHAADRRYDPTFREYEAIGDVNGAAEWANTAIRSVYSLKIEDWS